MRLGGLEELMQIIYARQFGDRRLRKWLSIDPDGASIHVLSTNAIDLPEFEDPSA